MHFRSPVGKEPHAPSRKRGSAIADQAARDNVEAILGDAIASQLREFAIDASADLSGPAAELARDLTAAAAEGRDDLVAELRAHARVMLERQRVQLAARGWDVLDATIGVLMRVAASGMARLGRDE